MSATAFLLASLLFCGAAVPAAGCSRQGRILGGREAEDGEFPFEVSLELKEGGVWKHFCGGVVLDDRHIITAAHCLCELKTVTVEWQVVAGTRYLYNQTDPNRVTRDVERYYFHEQYTFAHGSHDIAILRLTHRLPSNNPYVAAIPLAYQTPGISTVCTICGWGVRYFTPENPVSPVIMQTLNYAIIDPTKCAEYFTEGFMYKLDETMVCAGWEDKQVCNDDAGSAMVCDGKLAGLISWGYECALAEYPSVNTDVAKHQQWIADTLKRSAEDSAGNKSPCNIALHREKCSSPTTAIVYRQLLKSNDALRRSASIFRSPFN